MTHDACGGLYSDTDLVTPTFSDHLFGNLFEASVKWEDVVSAVGYLTAMFVAAGKNRAGVMGVGEKNTAVLVGMEFC